MVFGCRREICVNTRCRKNPNFLYAEFVDHEKTVKLANDIWAQTRRPNDDDENGSKKLQYWEAVCDVTFMRDITKTIQSSNLSVAADYCFMVEFVRSTYSFSLSFLKDPSLIGKQDEYGQLKYNLNLDEKAVRDFYKTIEDEC